MWIFVVLYQRMSAHICPLTSCKHVHKYTYTESSDRVSERERDREAAADFAWLRWKRTIKHCALNLIYRIVSSSPGNMYHRKAVFCISVVLIHQFYFWLLILHIEFRWESLCEYVPNSREKPKSSCWRGKTKRKYQSNKCKTFRAQCLTWFSQSHSIQFHYVVHLAQTHCRSFSFPSVRPDSSFVCTRDLIRRPLQMLAICFSLL